MAGSTLTRIAVKKDLDVELRLPPIPQIPPEVMTRLPQVATYLLDYNDAMRQWSDQVQQQLKTALSNVSAVRNVP